jgi:hypothetical protein
MKWRIYLIFLIIFKPKLFIRFRNIKSSIRKWKTWHKTHPFELEFCMTDKSTD